MSLVSTPNRRSDIYSIGGDGGIGAAASIATLFQVLLSCYNFWEQYRGLGKEPDTILNTLKIQEAQFTLWGEKWNLEAEEQLKAIELLSNDRPHDEGRSELEELKKTVSKDFWETSLAMELIEDGLETLQDFEHGNPLERRQRTLMIRKWIWERQIYYGNEDDLPHKCETHRACISAVSSQLHHIHYTQYTRTFNMANQVLLG
ncbi:hypothetical protein BGW36DRAFT_424723 [Talaromyces proteolyticus]|uniref:Prion-inhibition and propagation HeLo domain-containing protein n=1 Tax=Talaromyces proteolyticus TaxID=1131652 RepID=A0AAD4KWE9_9EURO|nr:uncharacterized protein BGW36DRAFT_424723 [Talaromyces proteolyticus]KAH8702447.1 hypothetical protein BGW36DRAFT_424723 [Talaromyces proteolyticus]